MVRELILEKLKVKEILKALKHNGGE